MKAEIGRWNRKNKELSEAQEEEAKRMEELKSEKETIKFEAASTSSAETTSEVPPLPPLELPELPSVIADICLLCERRFPTPELLQKHVELSELHKKNLEASASKRALFKQSRKTEMWRQHARKKQRKLESASPKEPLSQENVGAQMMKAMGWTAGSGLGKQGTGTTAPIEVSMRTERAGLGSYESVRPEDKITGEDTYQSAARKKARAMFYKEFGAQ